MNSKEADIVIADYMNEDYCQCRIYQLIPSASSHHDNCLNENCGKKICDHSYVRYSESLDKLKTVWKKLKVHEQKTFLTYNGNYRFIIFCDHYPSRIRGNKAEEKNFNHSAVIATAKAIQEITNVQEKEI